jgi:hypothetical protein
LTGELGPRILDVVKARRLWAGILLAASLAVSSAFHNHEDLAGGLQASAVDRVVSSHSPLSKAAHWHSGVRVKDDPCLACQSHRLAGLAADPCRETLVSISPHVAETLEATPASRTVLSNGSRAPPALL